MSGPKGIGYTIVDERRAVEQALREWRRLAGQARAVTLRCTASKVDGIDVVVGSEPTGPSESIRAACSALAGRVTAAERQLDAVLTAQRGRRADHDLGALLEELDRREAATTPTRHRPSSTDAGRPPEDGDDAAYRRHLGARVHRKLSSLLEPSGEFERAAAGILAAEPGRAELLLADLSARVRAANQQTEDRNAARTELEQLRSETTGLLESGHVLDALHRAQAVLDSGGEVAGILRWARRLIDDGTAAEQGERDRRYVLGVVTESLTALGYSVTDVDLGTADSMLLRDETRAGYALTAEVTEGQIDLRTVRTDDTATRATDTAAEQALCDRLPRLLDALGEHGVEPGRVRGAPVGVTQLRVVPLQAPRAGSEVRAAKSRRARPSERSRE